MKTWVGLALFLLLPFLAHGASFWDGNAAVQRGDAAFESGLYAVSNSFAPNTKVIVQSPAAGTSVTVTITGTLEGQPDMLLLLSPAAASALGLSIGSLANVRVTLPARQPVQAQETFAEQTWSTDPDVNPAAAYGGSGAETQPVTAAAEQAAQAEQPAETEQAAQAEQPAESEQAAQAEQPAETEEAAQAEQAPTVESLRGTSAPGQEPKSETSMPTEPEEPAPTDATASTQVAESPRDTQPVDDSSVLEEVAGRTPQKIVSLPPREDQAFAYVPPVSTTEEPAAEPAEEPAQVASAEEPAEPQVTAVIGEPPAAPAPAEEASADLAEVTAPQESRAEEIVGTETAMPVMGEESAVALVAPEPAHEEEAPAVETPVVKEPVTTEVTGPLVRPAAVSPSSVALQVPEAPQPESSATQATTTQATTTQATTTQAATTQAATTQATTTQAATTQAATTQATTTQAATTQAATTQAATTPTVTSVKPAAKSGVYYVQLAAYATEKGAQDLAATLQATYPMLVAPPSTQGSRMYRVLVGPLNKAESGTLLVWFRFRGYPDAFVRQD